MSQQFSIALIIKSVEIDNRKVQEKTFLFEVMPRSLECCYLQTFYWHYCEGKHAESYDIGCYMQHGSEKKRTCCIENLRLLITTVKRSPTAYSKFNQHFCYTVIKNFDYSIGSSIKCPHFSQHVIVIFMISRKFKCEVLNRININ